MTTSNDHGYLLERLARLIHRFDIGKINHEAVTLSRTAIVDTIGVTIAGVVEPCATNLMRTPGVATAPGTCSILGTARKTSALDATFINGTASHALDYDDFSQPMGGHQSAPLVAPLMAIAEERGLPGRAVINSYVVGIETEIRLARCVNFFHYDIGWHPTATLGVFGATAAVGHMIGFDEHKLTIAMAIANTPAFTLAGGGDTIAAIQKYDIYDKVSYISTAGGAFLEFLEGKTLPAVEILEQRAAQ